MPAEQHGSASHPPASDPGVLPIDTAWLSWLWSHLDDLAAGIRREQRREPDDGDLLVALGSAADSLTGRSLRELGVDLDALPGVVERLRAQPNDADLERQADRVRQQKELAIDEGQRETAKQLRSEERRLTHEMRRSRADTLQAIRRHLGIDQPSNTPSEGETR